MKKLVILFLSASTLLAACNSSKPTSEKTNMEPFIAVDEEFAEEQVNTVDWTEIINAIPSDAYIQVDGLHNMPISATLYKNSGRENLSIDDQRLIRLWNFYTNEVKGGVYSYSQGTVNGMYESVKNYDFRLELEFSPRLNGDSIETRFDKIVIIQDDFYCIITDVPFENYSYTALLRTPLYGVGELNWLSLFGF